MSTFKVLRKCRHDGMALKRGDTIESRHAIDKAWPERFERLEIVRGRSEIQPVRPIEPAIQPVDDRNAETGVDEGGDIPALPTSDSELVEPVNPAATLRKMKRRGRGKLFDVVNVETGKAVNEEGLTEAEADELVAGGMPDGNNGGNAE